MKRSGKIALGGLTAALAVVCMLLTALPVTVYALPALAGMLMLPIALEVGQRAGWGVYAVVSVLAFLLTPAWEPKLLFVLFFGYYPVLRLMLERCSRPIGWAVKFAVFNAAMIGAYALLIWLFRLPADSFDLFGINLPWVFLLIGNGVFVLYDFALARVTRLYQWRWHRLVRRLFK